jgi:hypothetical protein
MSPIRQARRPRSVLRVEDLETRRAPAVGLLGALLPPAPPATTSLQITVALPGALPDLAATVAVGPGAQGGVTVESPALLPGVSVSAGLGDNGVTAGVSAGEVLDLTAGVGVSPETGVTVAAGTALAGLTTTDVGAAVTGTGVTGGAALDLPGETLDTAVTAGVGVSGSGPAVDLGADVVGVLDVTAGVAVSPEDGLTADVGVSAAGVAVVEAGVAAGSDGLSVGAAAGLGDVLGLSVGTGLGPDGLALDTTLGVADLITADLGVGAGGEGLTAGLDAGIAGVLDVSADAGTGGGLTVDAGIGLLGSAAAVDVGLGLAGDTGLIGLDAGVQLGGLADVTLGVGVGNGGPAVGVDVGLGLLGDSVAVDVGLGLGGDAGLVGVDAGVQLGGPAGVTLDVGLGVGGDQGLGLNLDALAGGLGGAGVGRLGGGALLIDVPPAVAGVPAAALRTLSPESVDAARPIDVVGASSSDDSVSGPSGSDEGLLLTEAGAEGIAPQFAGVALTLLLPPGVFLADAGEAAAADGPSGSGTPGAVAGDGVGGPAGESATESSGADELALEPEAAGLTDPEAAGELAAAETTLEQLARRLAEVLPSLTPEQSASLWLLVVALGGAAAVYRTARRRKSRTAEDRLAAAWLPRAAGLAVGLE